MELLGDAGGHTHTGGPGEGRGRCPSEHFLVGTPRYCQGRGPCRRSAVGCGPQGLLGNKGGLGRQMWGGAHVEECGPAPPGSPEEGQRQMAAGGLRKEGEARPARPESLTGAYGPSLGSMGDAAFSSSRPPALCQLCAAGASPGESQRWWGCGGPRAAHGLPHQGLGPFVTYCVCHQ